MKKDVQRLIDDIYIALQSRKDSQIALFSGESGCCLFETMYINYVNDSSKFACFQNNIQTLIENSTESNYSPFCSGKAGINWFLTFLYKNDILEVEDLETLCEDDLQLQIDSLKYLQIGKYDFLHGAIGIGYYFLYSEASKEVSFFKKMFLELTKLAHGDKNIFHISNYDFAKSTVVFNQINIGLAHGIPSILKFCLQCYKQKICVEDSLRLAQDIITLIRASINNSDVGSIFPNVVNTDRDSIKYSRLGWCYGDLGIGYILYQAGLLFEDNELITFSTDVLFATTKRKMEHETMVKDAGVCHGSAGIAHIYNRMWHYTKKNCFKEACDFWIKKTIDFAIFDNQCAGFKSYEPLSEEIFKDSYALLDGISGIGLVLISYVTGNFDWDYCLMLNE